MRMQRLAANRGCMIQDGDSGWDTLLGLLRKSRSWSVIVQPARCRASALVILSLESTVGFRLYVED